MLILGCAGGTSGLVAVTRRHATCATHPQLSGRFRGAQRSSTSASVQLQCCPSDALNLCRSPNARRCTSVSDCMQHTQVCGQNCSNFQRGTFPRFGRKHDPNHAYSNTPPGKGPLHDALRNIPMQWHVRMGCSWRRTCMQPGLKAPLRPVLIWPSHLPDTFPFWVMQPTILDVLHIS